MQGSRLILLLRQKISKITERSLRDFVYEADSTERSLELPQVALVLRRSRSFFRLFGIGNKMFDCGLDCRAVGIL